MKVIKHKKEYLAEYNEYHYNVTFEGNIKISFASDKNIDDYSYIRHAENLHITSSV